MEANAVGFSQSDSLVDLRGYISCTRFWEKARGEFRPVVLPSEQQRELRRRVQESGVGPQSFALDVFDYVRRGRLREARKYANGELLVRYEHPDMGDECDYGGSCQLVMLLDSEFNPMYYAYEIGDGETVEIDFPFELKRTLAKARCIGEEVYVRTLEAIGVDDGVAGRDDECGTFALKFSAGDDIFARLYGRLDCYFGRDPEGWPDGDRRNVSMLLAYISLWAPTGHDRRAPAMNNLGEAFIWGDVVKEDPVVGEYWLRRAATSGNEYAKLWLAFVYSDPKGPFRDRAAAEHWLREAKLAVYADREWSGAQIVRAEAAIRRMSR